MLLIGRVLYAGGGAFNASKAACAAACESIKAELPANVVAFAAACAAFPSSSSDADAVLVRIVGVRLIINTLPLQLYADFP